MAGMNQTQSMSQNQVLAPQLQQSLQILQAPMLELRNLIQQELCSNPTLEEDQMEPTIEDKKQEHDEFQEEFDRLAKLDEEWRDYMAQSQSYSGRSAEDEERRQFFFDSLVGMQTLQQHLIEQLTSSDLSDADRQLGELIIGNIDDAGFLQAMPEEIAGNTGTEVADLLRVLEFVQTFHPVGVGARDLRECLLIQLRRLSKEHSLEYRIVDRHIDDLGKRRFPEIARRLGTTTEQVQRAAGFVGTLDPKPGQIFTPDPNNYVLPDVNVEKIGGIHAGVIGDVLGRGLEKAGVVNVADEQFRELVVGGAEVRRIELLHEVLLERLHAHDAVEKKLPPFLLLRRAPRVALALRHVIAPFVIELRQPLEFLLKLVVLLLLVLDGRLHLIFFERRIRAKFLLDQIAQLEHGSLQDLQALLELRRENLALGQGLRLRKSGHGKGR